MRLLPIRKRKKKINFYLSKKYKRKKKGFFIGKKLDKNDKVKIRKVTEKKNLLILSY